METDTQVVEAETEVKAQSAETEEVFDKERAMNTINKLRETEKEYKRQQKELAELKAEKEKRALAEMSETERLKKQAEQAEAENAHLKVEMIRRDVVAETGLPAIFADRLKGNTKEEMLADAQELAKTLPTLKVAPKIPATNPNNAQTGETPEQRRERLFGKQGNVFDLDAIKQAGGGVVWHKPT